MFLLAIRIFPRTFYLSKTLLLESGYSVKGTKEIIIINQLHQSIINDV